MHVLYTIFFKLAGNLMARSANAIAIVKAIKYGARGNTTLSQKRKNGEFTKLVWISGCCSLNKIDLHPLKSCFFHFHRVQRQNIIISLENRVTITLFMRVNRTVAATIEIKYVSRWLELIVAVKRVLKINIVLLSHSVCVCVLSFESASHLIQCRMHSKFEWYFWLAVSPLSSMQMSIISTHTHSAVHIWIYLCVHKLSPGDTLLCPSCVFNFIAYSFPAFVVRTLREAARPFSARCCSHISTNMSLADCEYTHFAYNDYYGFIFLFSSKSGQSAMHINGHRSGSEWSEIYERKQRLFSLFLLWTSRFCGHAFRRRRPPTT